MIEAIGWGSMKCITSKCNRPTNRGSYMSAHVLLNLLNKLRKHDKKPSILLLFSTSLIKVNNTGVRM